MSRTTTRDALPVRALEWIARLPLLGDEELASLLGVHELDAAHARHALDRLGWVEWVVPGSPELRQRRLSLLRAEAAVPFAALVGSPSEDLARALCVRPRDVLARAVSVEATAGVNRLVADLAAGPGVDAPVELVDARALPVSRPRTGAWWPDGVDAYGCLRAGALYAPFFVAWDRAHAPAAHRRARVAAWHRFDPAGTVWGAGGLPPVLVVCAGDRERTEWAADLERRREREDCQVHAVMTSVAEALSAGPGAGIWRLPGRRGRVRLVEGLGWGPKPPVPAPLAIDRDGNGPLPRLISRRPPLREWASRAAADVAGARTRVERLAAISLGTDADEQRLLEWLARHPLLTPAQLATLLDRPLAAVERRLHWLMRCALVQALEAHGEADASSRPLVLRSDGLRWLAQRDGVPPRRYAKHGTAAALPGAGMARSPRLAGLVRHLDHSLGVNRVLVRLAADARRAGHRLVEWSNEAEAAHRFTHHGRRYWIRPDAGGALRCGEARHEFVLEYDRGTLDAWDYRAKFTGYHHYFKWRAARGEDPLSPAVLVVAADDRAERRVVRAARIAAREFGAPVPLLTTAEWRFERDPANPDGLLGAIWRSPHADDGSRAPWPPRLATTAPACSAPS